MMRIRYQGQPWQLTETTRTSDGFLLATGVLIDEEFDTPALDDDGFPILHSFFLGKAD